MGADNEEFDNTGDCGCGNNKNFLCGQNCNNNYYNKYLKYKQKYLSLKQMNMKGGGKKNIYLFKSDRCSHCVKFKPTWEIMEKKYGNKYNFITYDNNEHTLKFVTNKINGIPSIRKDSNGQMVEYEGPREEKFIIEWVEQD